MIKNLLKIAYRNLQRNKVYVGINIVGLGLALACCMIAYLNSKFNWDFDKNHVKIDHIYKVHAMQEYQASIDEFGRVPMPMADALRADFPNIDKVFRFESHVFTVRDNNLDQDKVFNTSVCYAEPGFIESFTFNMLKGDREAYHRIDEAIVTDTYARKFYGDENPLGKVITVFDDTGMSFNFIISGVTQEAPQNSSVHFEVLVNFENRFRMYDDNVKNNWGAFAQNTFVYFNDPSQSSIVEPQLDQYLELQHEARPDFLTNRFILRPMNTHAREANEINAVNLRQAMNPAAVITPQIMALLILLVACFNFTNTAIANSNRRLKEIGVRKVLGGSRRQLITQFMIENLVVCFLALLVSIGISSYLVPAYSAMWDVMDLQLDFESDIRIYLFMALLLIFTTILAGFYPSLYISKYKPVNILRGSLSIGGAGRLTKVLLASQYTFTIIAVFASVAFIQNARYQETLDLGYNDDQIIGINLLNQNQYDKIQTAMLANPAITQFASAKHHIGRGNYGLTLKSDEVEVAANMMDVGLGYTETMDLQILEGRTFSKELEASDSQNSILVNERLVEEFGWTDPIGQRVSVNDSTKLTVIGVVKNFYMYGFWAPVSPMGLRLQSLKFQDDGTYSYIVAKTKLNQVREVYDYLEDEWNSAIPNKTFAGFYQDEILGEAKKVNNNIMLIFSFLGVVAFTLSALGLYTLVSINLIKRTKEIGIRMALGGSLQHIVSLIGRGYLVLLVISSALGLTAGYYMINGLISSIFRNYKELDYVTFLIPALVVIVISLIITGMRTVKAATMNPTRSLRYE